MRKLSHPFFRLPGIKQATKKLVSWKANKEAKTIASHFNQFLQPHLAMEQELRDEVHKIRHNVYCEELHFEDEKPDGKEQDEFDQYSLFCVIEHKSSHNFAGCVRIVSPATEDELLPMEKYCEGAISDDQIQPSQFPREKICEISRLAVPSQFRRRNVDKYEGCATGVINEQTYSEKEMRCFPFIAIGLYLSAASVGINKGIEHFFVMMEPRLARSMRFIGINFKQIGPTVEYHGKRAPYYICPKVFLDSLAPGFKVMYENMDKNLRTEMAAYGLIDLASGKHSARHVSSPNYDWQQIVTGTSK